MIASSTVMSSAEAVDVAAATALGTSDVCILRLALAALRQEISKACNLRTIPNRAIENWRR
jgi:hypothetical protein